MARNLEIKVRCNDRALDVIRERLLARGEAFDSMRQVDTYYVVTRGRLKLREIETEAGSRTVELIAYMRPDRSGSRWSDYERVTIAGDATDGMKRALETVCGVGAVVDKRREVVILRRTRVHLDRVAGLGCFVELETVAGNGEDGIDDLALEHGEIIDFLGLAVLEVVAGSYGDLIGTTEGE